MFIFTTLGALGRETYHNMHKVCNDRNAKEGPPGGLAVHYEDLEYNRMTACHKVGNFQDVV